ncbi:RHS repeat-associated core domain-containing protein [Pseudomonas putida]|jgi:RHS repeat-associated protein|uniref:RHS repeat-associated core domain-containing protein n=1 Tax=Pseudomonas putida TaxID=303 RepID=UPI0021646753|nr:RHS repeat-associated core domain-containing protein [Pseudomonas putida]
MRIFYQHNLANTRIGQAGSTRALSEGRLTLAIRHSSQPYPNLVASNMLNTTTAIVSPGKITSIAYTPFGFAHQEQQTSVGFNGEYPDPLTGNYGLGQGYRWYSPTLKRFQAADDISPFGQGGISAYAYTHNDPVNRFDPDGHNELRYFRNLKAIKLNRTNDGPEGFFSYQSGSGKPSLVVDLHGSEKGVLFAGKLHEPKQFLELLDQLKINTNDYKSLIIAACHTGKTFAPEIARATNKPVQAPAGVFMTANDFDASTNTYVLSYIRKPGADFFLQPRLAPAESYVFGLQKFAPPQTKAQDIRHSVKTGR